MFLPNFLGPICPSIWYALVGKGASAPDFSLLGVHQTCPLYQGKYSTNKEETDKRSALLSYFPKLLRKLNLSRLVSLFVRPAMTMFVVVSAVPVDVNMCVGDTLLVQRDLSVSHVADEVRRLYEEVYIMGNQNIGKVEVL